MKEQNDMFYLKKENVDLIQEFLKSLIDTLEVSIKEMAEQTEKMEDADSKEEWQKLVNELKIKYKIARCNVGDEIQNLKIKLDVLFSEIPHNIKNLEVLREEFSDKQMYILCINLRSNLKKL